MAWETRNGSRYYYRKRRIGKQVVSEYLGGGELAGLFAMLDEEKRLERDFARREWQEVQRTQQAMDAQIDELIRLLQPLVNAVLVEAGYHRHKGQWRRRRERNTDTR